MLVLPSEKKKRRLFQGSHELSTSSASALLFLPLKNPADAGGVQKTGAGSKSPHLHSLLVEVYEREGTEDALNEAIDVLQFLRNELDVVRAKYWEARLRHVARRLGDLVSEDT